jgi:hypothetical protein
LFNYIEYITRERILIHLGNRKVIIMPSKNNPELSPEETRELLVQGDENSLEAIKDLTEALAEHKNNAESFVAITLAERAKIRGLLAKRQYWEAGVIDPYPVIPPPPPRPRNPIPQ